MDLSIVIPAYNEERNLPALLGDLKAFFSQRRESFEIIVVNDASRDRTAAAAESAGARVVSHPYNLGNGAAVKTGLRAATGEVVVLMDADGQHRPEVIPELLEQLKSY